MAAVRPNQPMKTCRSFWITVKSEKQQHNNRTMSSMSIMSNSKTFEIRKRGQGVPLVVVYEERW